MNATTNYQLSQWDASDRVLRTDFNADNAKIEAALSGLSDQAAPVPDLAFYVGQLMLKLYHDTKRYPSQRSIELENFEHEYSTNITTGDVKVVNNVLTLTGAGKTGTFSNIPISIRKYNWRHARLFLHANGGKVTPTISGSPMTLVSQGRSRTVLDVEAWEYEYVWSGTPASMARIVLELNCGKSDSMEVYDYAAFFY